jgi:hypothetical protein
MSKFVRAGIARLSRRMGPAGLIVGVIALVAAVAGGAYAASGGLTAKEKKEVKKIARNFAGKPGANGKDGANGARGPAGPQGPAGQPGVSVTSKTLNPGNPKCPQGGSEFTADSGNKTYACTGKEGKSGFASELPSGKTSVGAWSTDLAAEGQFALATAISFPYPVEEAGYPVHYVTTAEAEGGTAPAACPGTAAEAEAEAGNLCVYESNGFGALFLVESDPETGGFEVGAGKAGVILRFSAEEANSSVSGTWALTAE